MTVRDDEQNRSSTQTFQHLWKASMALASVSLSIVSFYTTFAGTNQFMPTVLALMYTFGVQVLLLVSAWYVGLAKDLLAPQSILMSGLFAVAFVMSASFSTIEIFDIGYEDDVEATALRTRALGAYERGNGEIRAMLSSQRSEQSEDLLGSDAFEAWEDSVQEVALVATNVEDELAEVQTRRRNDELARLETLRDTTARFQSELDAVRSRLEEISGELARGSERIREYEADVAALEDQVNAQEDVVSDAREAVENEIAFGDPEAGRPPGPGPFADKLTRIAETEERRLSLQTASLEEARRDLQNERERERALTSEQNRLNADEDSLSERIQVQEGDISGLQTTENQTSDTQQINFSEAGDRMGALIEAYKNSLALADFQAVNRHCDSILSALRSPAVSDSIDLSGLSCSQASIRGEVERLDGIRIRERDFSAACLVGGRNYHSLVDEVPRTIILEGRKCVGLAGLPVSLTSSIMGEYELLMREGSPDALPYVKLKNAAYDGDPTVMIAVLLAILMDGLVLACALAGGRGDTAARLALGGETMTEDDIDELADSVTDLFGSGTTASLDVSLKFLSSIHRTDRPGKYSDTVSYPYYLDLSKIPAGLNIQVLTLLAHALSVGDNHHATIDRERGQFLVSNAAVSALKKIVVRFSRKDGALIGANRPDFTMAPDPVATYDAGARFQSEEETTGSDENVPELEIDPDLYKSFFKRLDQRETDDDAPKPRRISEPEKHQSKTREAGPSNTDTADEDANSSRSAEPAPEATPHGKPKGRQQVKKIVDNMLDPE